MLMPEYILIVRRPLVQEATISITAKSKQEAREKYYGGKYTIQWSEPEGMEEYIAHIIELPDRERKRK